MKRRRPVLELDNNFSFSRESKVPSVVSAPKVSVTAVQPLVSYNEDSDTETNTSTPNVSLCNPINNAADNSKPYTAWQMCVDENTGYTYYWNVDTNQVTWETPPEYLAYETALQQYNTTNVAPSVEVDAVTKNRIARTTMEVIANRAVGNVLSKKPNTEMKSAKDGKVELVAYGPTWEDDGSEDAEAKKMASARKRLLSYKSDKLKSRVDEPENVSKTPPPALQVSSPPPSTAVKSTINVMTPLAQKTDFMSSRIPFVPTPDEIKEHPIFSNFASPKSVAVVSCVGAVGHSSNGSELLAKPIVNIGPDGKKPRLIDENYSDSDPDEEEDDEDENLDDVIITRLRKKALLLQELGGDVPKEILSVLDNSKTAQDIIAEIEKEIPPDSADDGCVMMDIDSDEFKPVDTSLSAKPVQPQPLFPIADYVEAETKTPEPKPHTRSVPPPRKTQMKNIQKIKLSARARELIKTSLLTAKARATNFVETADGLKPAEEVQKLEEEMKTESIVLETTVKCEPIPVTEFAEEQRKRQTLEKFKAEIDALCPPSQPEVVAESKPESAQFVTSSADTTIEPTEILSVPAVGSIAYDERTGLGFGDIVTSGDDTRGEMKFVKVGAETDEKKEDKFGFQTSFVVPNTRRTKAQEEAEAKQVSLVSKCEEFLQSVKKTVAESGSVGAAAKKKKKTDEKKLPAKEPSKEFKDIDIDEVLNTKEDNEEKNIIDLSQLIMEKLKFLNDGKGVVTPVQVMAIQIETLVGAWQTQALTSTYLRDWLDVSAVHLKRIEEAAAPDGWQCEWDRSYGRYYYRDKATGTIQWDFPEVFKEQPTIVTDSQPPELATPVRPKTPPPPMISEEMVPPPPPIISDHDSRKRRTSPVAEQIDPERKRQIPGTEDRSTCSAFDAGNRAPPLPPAPPLPVLPPKPPTPPPPPPTPSPPPPPPPVISTSEKPAVGVIEPCPVFEVQQESRPSHPVGLHDELDSFYSDIASIEATFSQTTDEAPPGEETPAEKSLKPVVATVASTLEEKVTKKKKKVKLDASLSLKKKGLEGLVAKWQKVSSDI